MSVSRVRKTIVSIRLTRPILSAVRNTDHVISVLVEVETEGGPSGVSYWCAFKIALQRLTLAKIFSTLAVQTKGLG